MEQFVNFSTFFAVIGALLVYLWTSSRRIKMENNRASKNLLNEIKAGFNSLNDVYPVEVKSEDSVYTFVHVEFNHGFHDSLASSGNINYLDSEQQQKIEDIFRYIKRHNALMKRLWDLEINIAVNKIKKTTEVDRNTIELTSTYTAIVEVQKYILSSAPPIIKDLENTIHTKWRYVFLYN